MTVPTVRVPEGGLKVTRGFAGFWLTGDMATWFGDVMNQRLRERRANNHSTSRGRAMLTQEIKVPWLHGASVWTVDGVLQSTDLSSQSPPDLILEGNITARLDLFPNPSWIPTFRLEF